MDNIEMWQLVVGFISPIIIASIQQPKWPDWIKAVVMFLFSAVVGGLGAYLAGAVNAPDLITNILVVMVATITFYKGLWKPTGVAGRVEDWTSPREHDEDDLFD